jgi:hypothetical protein
MVGGGEVGRITNGTAKFDRFEGVGIIKREELHNKVGTFRHEPQMKVEVARVQGTASIHEAAKGWIGGRIGAESDSDVRETIIDGNGHTLENEKSDSCANHLILPDFAL